MKGYGVLKRFVKINSPFAENTVGKNTARMNQVLFIKDDITVIESRW